MKIALSALKPSMDSMLDPRFGRCSWFLIIETEDLSYEAVENNSGALGHGAGIQTAEMLANIGVMDVITGNCGPKAFRALSAAGVRVISGCSGLIKDLLEKYNAGELSYNTHPDVNGHYGEGAVDGAGRDMGTGGGRGMGGGRRMAGRGFPRSAAGSPQGRPQPLDSADQPVVEAFTRKADALRGQIESIQERIRRLKKNRK